MMETDKVIKIEGEIIPFSSPPNENSPLISVKEPIKVHHGIGGSTIPSAVFNLSTTSIGAGIMALPATIKVLGLPLGLMMIATLGVFTDESIALIMRFSHALNVHSYGDLMDKALGHAGRKLVHIFTITHTFGCMIVYLIIIADVLSGSTSSGVHSEGILEEWAGGSVWWNTRFAVLLLTSIFVLFPLVSLRKIDSLMLTSALSVVLAVIFVLYTSIAAIVKFFKGELESPRLWPQISDFSDFVQLFTVVPVMTNAFICHYNVHPIYDELSCPTEGRMRLVSRYSQLLCTLVYLCTGMFGYLLFGDDTASDLLVNFNTSVGLSQTANDIVRLGYVIHLMLVFPIINFPLRQTIDFAFFPKSSRPLIQDDCRFNLITVSLLAVIFLVSTLIPDIYDVFSFLGGTVAISIGFTFPAIIALRCKAADVSRGERWEAWVMLGLGVFVTVTSVSTDIYEIVVWLLNSA